MEKPGHAPGFLILFESPRQGAHDGFGSQRMPDSVFLGTMFAQQRESSFSFQHGGSSFFGMYAGMRREASVAGIVDTGRIKAEKNGLEYAPGLNPAAFLRSIP